MKKDTGVILFLIAVIIVVALLFLNWKLRSNNKPGMAKNSVEISQDQRINILMSIEDFTENDLSFKLEKDSSIFDVLKIINMTNPELNLEYSEYGSMGVLIEQLGNKINGENNKYWQYYVGGKQPMVSVDNYILKDGDKVGWVFKKSEL